MFTVGVILCLIIILLIHPCLNLCVERERRALLEIEKDIYDPDDWLSSWRKGGDCCNWQGVICNNATGNVISLDLQYPYDWSNDEAQKPGESRLNPSLVNLKYLTYLDLSSNNFFGASIPDFIGSLTRLEYLDLSSSGFKGTIPPQLGNLSSLQTLRINNGYDPSTFDLRVDNLHWLSRLTSLTDLQMNSVDLSAAVDWIHDISKLPFISTISLEYDRLSSIPVTVPPLNNFTFLQSLDLWGNPLNSTIPSWLFYNITSLEELSLGICGLYGELPLFPGQVSSLKYLNLPRNEFDGQVFRHLDMLPLLKTLDLSFNNINASISDNLWNLTQLTKLELSVNQIHGSLPKTLGNYIHLETLMLSSNSITGEIPYSIGNLYSLFDLYLDHNNIGGHIPDSIGNLKRLDGFDVSTNLMSGEIPHSLFSITNLSSLTLSNNNFSGLIPKSIRNLKNLNSLDLSNNILSGHVFFGDQSPLLQIDLSNNSLSGTLPFIQNKSSQLIVLNLSNNRFSGTIPNLFNFHPFLQSLQLGKNNLNGPIPSSLKYCKQLTVLDLSENKLYGKIPPWIGGELSSLRILSLRSNGFTGQIPTELSYLTSLQILDISQNSISGNFSLYFDNFTVMTTAKNTSLEDFFAFGNVLYVENIWLNKQGFERQYTSSLFVAIVMDVSSNELSGEISNGITKLLGLKFLNMSHNQFGGNIPKNIDALRNLEVLDLSANKISGQIPSAMTGMTSLGFLNLSNNKLSGMIPVGNQFGSFDNPSIYNGNRDLCGWPLQKCPGRNSSNTSSEGKEIEEQEYWFESIWINAGAAIGFLISFWGFFITLMLNQSIRSLHFYYVDKLYHWICYKFDSTIAKIKSKVMETEMH